MAKEDKRNGGGITEGIARGLSQACVYAVEARKSVVQVYGKQPLRMDPCKVFLTMLQSAASSGVVFGMYFSTYNAIGMSNPLAGPLSSIATSMLKLPISNCMRMIQVDKASNLVNATRKIVRTRGVRGLYNGYTLSLIEDMIETDMRTRLYVGLKQENNLALNVGLGAISGMIAAYITSPFDLVRANMSVHNMTCTQIVQDIWKKDGVLGLYRGGSLRMCSNGVKYALFFMFFELLSSQNTSCQSRA